MYCVVFREQGSIGGVVIGETYEKAAEKAGKIAVRLLRGMSCCLEHHEEQLAASIASQLLTMDQWLDPTTCDGKGLSLTVWEADDVVF